MRHRNIARRFTGYSVPSDQPRCRRRHSSIHMGGYCRPAPHRVGAAAWQAIDPLHNLPSLPATQNVFWDQHYYSRVPNVLGSSQTNTCTATCMQWYYCANTVEGRFSIQYTLTKES